MLRGLPPSLCKVSFWPLVLLRVPVDAFISRTHCPLLMERDFSSFLLSSNAASESFSTQCSRQSQTNETHLPSLIMLAPSPCFLSPGWVLIPQSKRAILGRGHRLFLFSPTRPSGDEKVQQSDLGWTLLSGNMKPFPLAEGSLSTSFRSKTTYLQFKEPPCTDFFRA